MQASTITTQAKNYRKRRWIVFTIVIAMGVTAISIWFCHDFFAPISPPTRLQHISNESPAASSPPNDHEKQSYTVPPAYPRRLIIASIGVDALVKPVAVLANNTLAAPKTAWDVGWYDKSGLPGASGTLLIDGHVNDSYGTLGIFGKLAQIKANDDIAVERGDGVMTSYRVITVEQTPADQVDMNRLLRPMEGKQGLNLITCGGAYDKKTGLYSDRVLVFATRA